MGDSERRSKHSADVLGSNYSYNGSLLMAQVTGSGAGQIKQLYSYDAWGKLVSVNYNGTEYYYMRNGQNDIVGLMDNSGAVVVSYSYDSWGKSLTVSDTLATTLGANNPFRYRGYYYDTETGLSFDGLFLFCLLLNRGAITTEPTHRGCSLLRSRAPAVRDTARRSKPSAGVLGGRFSGNANACCLIVGLWLFLICI